MSWQARLHLNYRRDVDRTVAHDRHEGPLRVLAALYPEGPGICHHVLVHPPGGIVGGDRLDVEARLGPNTHALLTTPGAGRFYRSAGIGAEQHMALQVGVDARLEWLPLETIVYSGADAFNEVRFELDTGAEMIGWDVIALGLPVSGQPFVDGRCRQRLLWPGRWLEDGRIRADDPLLLDSPLGWAGRRVLGTAWFAAADGLSREAREQRLDEARHVIDASMLADAAGATSPTEGLVVLRVLGERVEPVMSLLTAARAAWRRGAWGLAANPPRVWRT